jgi:SAM-dependent methyltransferase
MKKRSDYHIYSDGEAHRGKTTKEVFRNILHQGNWHLASIQQSVSGPGSEKQQTRTILRELSGVIRKFNIKSFLDIPCGDFNWLNEMDWKGIRYLGGDILEELIESNQRLYGKRNIRFEMIDILKDKMPDADILFCRDCLVHFSFENIAKALKNVKNSSIKYFMATSFPDETENEDIVTGGWRPLNMLLPPINLPEPLLLINENCTEEGGVFKDKSMALWSIDELSI